MKSLMILGALIGFGIGMLFGLADSGQWPAALWRASAAALMGSLLLRWWGRVWVQSLREDAMRRAEGRPAETKPGSH